MNDNLNNDSILDNEAETIETVEFTLIPPKANTLITCTDPDGYDQSPIPEIEAKSDKYYIDSIMIDGKERKEIYYREYSTLVYYSNVKVEKGKTYTVFGKVKAKPGYIFNDDPTTVIINGEELSSEVVEDYSLELDSFTFYFDIEAI